MRKLFFGALLLMTVFFLRRFYALEKALPHRSIVAEAGFNQLPADSSGKIQLPTTKPRRKLLASTEAQPQAAAPPPMRSSASAANGGPGFELVIHQSQEAKASTVHFEMEDGLAVAEGDLVLGKPMSGTYAASGIGRLPKTSLWPNNQIPVFIEPHLPHPERIQQALALFSATSLKFVPYIDQEDVLVFQEGQGSCKSYVGRVGGKQPLWISAGCGASEIAHEIMHALGFVHEQNRSDRDSSIAMDFANIEEAHRINFEKMTSEMMRISGLTEFDFSSIMIYPDTMFSKNGQPTMRTLNGDHHIEHSDTLSAKDIERLERAYGSSETFN